MQLQSIDSFTSFCKSLRQVGFSMGGSNDEGIFSLSRYFSDNIESHTGDLETDPWQWRIRGITECDDIAYGKFFFNKGGWITKEWFPYFMAIRRGHRTFNEMYEDGLISIAAKQVYELIQNNPGISLFEIKNTLGKDNSKLESTLTMLQMKMLITINGERFKISKDGKEYGWPVTTFCTAEEFFGEDIFEKSCSIGKQEAMNKISEQVLTLNPDAKEKDICKFTGVNSK